jgi:hypothetical protein
MASRMGLFTFFSNASRINRMQAARRSFNFVSLASTPVRRCFVSSQREVLRIGDSRHGRHR